MESSDVSVDLSLMLQHKVGEERHAILELTTFLNDREEDPLVANAIRSFVVPGRGPFTL